MHELIMDIQIEDHGSIVLLRPMSKAGAEWVAEYIHEPQWYCGAVVCDHRMAGPVIEGMVNDELDVAV